MMKSNDYRNTVAQWEAEHIWAIYGISKPDELCLEDVAFERGIIVTEGPLEKMDARLVRSGNKGLIRINQNIPYVGQKRFAIAHELGHWQLHDKISQFFACTSDDMVASYKRSPQEGEANIFAASLLMPYNLFRVHANNKKFSIQTISDLAEYFITSLTATAIRYVDLNDDYIAIVCSEAGKIKWWRGSDCFENKFWMTPGTKLSTNTIAGSLFFNNHKSEDSEEVDIKAWCDKGSYCESDTFIEESKHFKRYNQIITLLKLP